jgi:catechol 2,3-dioxygenase-like lactoylglutathione lyase family enzyme
VIDGVHLIVYTPRVEAVQRFFRDVLGLDSIDAGGGWPIFSLPPAELAVHPTGEGQERQEIFLMCGDLEATAAALKAKGVELSSPISEQSWGRLTAIRIPGAGEIALYQPAHPRP